MVMQKFCCAEAATEHVQRRYKISKLGVEFAMSFKIELAGRDLSDMHFGGYLNPYFTVCFISASGKRSELYKSEIRRHNLNPDWRPLIL
jgi:hypothetical protein